MGLSLRTYWLRDKTSGHPTTIGSIVQRWAPASDGNNPDDYASKVSRWTGIDRTQALPDPALPTSWKAWGKIVAAMARVECGIPADKIPWLEIQKASFLAFGFSPTVELALYS